MKKLATKFPILMIAISKKKLPDKKLDSPVLDAAKRKKVSTP